MFTVENALPTPQCSTHPHRPTRTGFPGVFNAQSWTHSLGDSAASGPGAGVLMLVPPAVPVPSPCCRRRWPLSPPAHLSDLRRPPSCASENGCWTGCLVSYSLPPGGSGSSQAACGKQEAGGVTQPRKPRRQRRDRGLAQVHASGRSGLSGEKVHRPLLRQAGIRLTREGTG